MLAAVAGVNSINASAWSTSSLDLTRFYTFNITPPSTCALDITSISVDTKASTTGPTSAAIATSADSFAAKTALTPGTSTGVALAVTGAMSSVEVRVYGYMATGGGGTLRIQNTLTVSGSLK